MVDGNLHRTSREFLPEARRTLATMLTFLLPKGCLIRTAQVGFLLFFCMGQVGSFARSRGSFFDRVVLCPSRPGNGDFWPKTAILPRKRSFFVEHVQFRSKATHFDRKQQFCLESKSLGNHGKRRFWRFLFMEFHFAFLVSSRLEALRLPVVQVHLLPSGRGKGHAADGQSNVLTWKRVAWLIALPGLRCQM